MKVTARNIIEIIIASILLLLVFLEPFYNGYTITAVDYITEKYDGTADVGHIKFGNAHEWSVFDLTHYGGSGTLATSGSLKRFFAYGMLIVSVISIALFVYQFVSKKKNCVFTLIPPFIQSILLAVYTFSAAHYSDEFKNYQYNRYADTFEKEVMRPATFFWFFLVLLVVLLCISIIGYFVAKKRGVIEQNEISYTKEVTG